MIMTSSPQQTSFLNTNGTQNITPFTANTNNNNKNNQLSTIQQIQVQQAQQQQQLIQQMARNQQQQQQQIQQYLANQRTQQMMNQHQIPPHPQHFNVNPMNIMNPMNSINTMQQAMISPSTPSISSALSMPSPNVITNVSTTPRQSYPSHHIYGHNAHTHGHTHNQYHHTHGHGHGHSNDGVSPQHRPQTPITSIQSTGAPSVTSITSFTSMPSIGPNTIMGITAAASFHGHGHGHHNNDNTQAPNNLFNQQQNTFNNNGTNNNNNNQQQNNNNNSNNNNNNNDDGKQGGDSSASNGPSAVLGQPPNSVIVNVSSNNKYGLRNYLVRARRILRLAKKCRICGIGSAVSVACEVTEVLKREKVAKVLHLSTGLIDDEQSTRPTIEIVVQRGKFAHLVSDFRRRKVIEVFEKKDCNIGGALPFDFVRKLDLAAKFKADCYRTHQAKRYLQCLQQDPEVSAVNLPKFIHYCSIIIHPLLLEYHFKMAISELGGYVDVHDGHLPREHTEEKVQQLQKLGRIQPFLASGDDIEFDPSDFRHWFNMNHMNNRNMNMAVNKQQQQQQQQENNVYIINQQQQQLQQLQQQQENEKNKIPNYPNPMNINNINNINNTNNNSNMNELQANNNYDSMNSMNINNENNGSLCLVDDSINNDNTTTNAIDGGSMTRIMSNDQPQHSPPHVVPLQVEAIIKKHEEDYTDNVRVIPEDESITQDIDDESEQHNKEIQHKIDNVIEEDDGSEPVKATSEVSKATTILSINNDD